MYVLPIGFIKPIKFILIGIMLQCNKLCDILHTLTNQKGKTMFDLFKDYDKKLKEFQAQVKQVNDFWIDSIISSLKALQK